LIVIPAIDIKGGRCVRLKQGRMSDETVFSDAPEEMAVRWFDQGAERIHVVDLDGAISGKPTNSNVIENIINAVNIPIELGGGIRDMDTADFYMEMGVGYLILGTVAFKDPGFAFEACERFKGRVIIGIDGRKGRVAVEGWTEETQMTPVEMAKRFEGKHVSAIIYTDIQRDGMKTGPNIEATKALAKAIKIPVIASGGISGISDIREISKLSRDGVMGMITGRALYDGSFSLSEAVEVLRRA
jgi:phosphoribosylformimino-5-aminoimidazole carboxamide ribotide isomerase